jgi:3-hydroxybutyryl-CoA dehydrogenase
MVTAGNIGVKSGMGFYDYSKGIKEASVASSFLN